MTITAEELQQYAALQIVRIGLDKLCDVSLTSQDMYISDLCIELEKHICVIESINSWDGVEDD